MAQEVINALLATLHEDKKIREGGEQLLATMSSQSGKYFSQFEL